MDNITIGSKIENEGRDSQGTLSAQEFNNLVNKVKELVVCVNNNNLETVKDRINSISNILSSISVPSKVSQLLNDRNFTTIDDVNELIAALSGGGSFTIPVVSELGTSYINAISQNFFTDCYTELKTKIENKGSTLATFDVEEGCLVMNELENTNYDFSISEDGNLNLEIYG